MVEEENNKRPSSSNELAEYLQECEEDVIHAMIQILRSNLCDESIKLAQTYNAIVDIPVIGTESRVELGHKIIKLLGWYGSNTFAYIYRKLVKGEGAKPYLSVLQDVVRLFNKRLPKKERKNIPIAAGASDLETILVEILVSIRFQKKTNDEIVQILEESGLEKHVAEEVAKRYGPAGLVGMSLPVITKLLGKKTVMTVVQQLTVAIVGRFVSKEAAEQMAKRMALKIAQKTLTRLTNWIGWILLTVDIICFVASPARRITTKAVPLIALGRVRGRLEKGENS